MQRKLTILLTGFTSRQANTVSERADIYITFGPILKRLLESLGHTVDWRPVKFGEHGIEHYDAVFVGCSDPNSMTGQTHRYGAIWAMMKATRLALWFDDWRIKGQLHTFLKKPEVFWNTRMLHESQLPTHEEALMLKAPIDHMLNELGWPQQVPVVAQLFNWGELDKFKKECPDARWYMRFDPSCYVPNFITTPTPMAEKLEGWVAASLTQMDDYTDKLGAKWPIIKQAKPKGKGFGGWKKLHERDVVTQLYDKYAGLISKPYPHAGSGWWRVRFNYACHARAIMLASVKEAGAIGPAFHVTAPQVEAMSVAARANLAQLQYEQFMHWQSSEEQVKDLMYTYLTRLLDEPTRPRYL